jgi:cytochrome c
MPKRRWHGGGVAGLLCILCACGVDSPTRLARAATGGDPDRGRHLIRQYGCGTCHEIPGAPGARGTIGPPLEKVAMRSFLAGRLSNTPENMMRWIRHPQQEEPGVVMPEMGVTDADARDLAAYLYTLR